MFGKQMSFILFFNWWYAYVCTPFGQKLSSLSNFRNEFLNFCPISIFDFINFAADYYCTFHKPKSFVLDVGLFQPFSERKTKKQDFKICLLSHNSFYKRLHKTINNFHKVTQTCKSVSTPRFTLLVHESPQQLVYILSLISVYCSISTPYP